MCYAVLVMTEPKPATVATPEAAPAVSAFSRWRRRLSPLVLVGAVLLLGRDMCDKQDAAPVTIRLAAPALDRRITRMRGDIKRRDSVVATFDRQAQGAHFGQITIKLPIPQPVSLLVEVFVDNRSIQLNRSLSPSPGSEVSIDLSAELVGKLPAASPVLPP